MALEFDEIRHIDGPDGEVISASIEPWSWPEFSEEQARCIGDYAVALNNSPEWWARRRERESSNEPFDPTIPPKLVDFRQ